MTNSTFTSEQSGSSTVEETAREHPSLVAVMRLGWVAKGVVYLLVGILAVPIAVNGLTSDSPAGGREASQMGAVAELADTSFGVAVLWVIAIGLALYVIWRLISVLLPAENTASVWLTRIGYLISAVVYGMLAWTAASFAMQGSLRVGAGAKTPRSNGSPGN